MRKQTLHVFFVSLLGLLIVSLFALFPGQASATNPNLVNFQGKVVNGSGSGSPGTNVADGSYTFRFCLYSTATPTTPCTASANNDAVWRESKSLTVTSGVFQTELGDVTTLPDFSSNSNLYLGVTFNGDAAGEMLPRIHLDSAPFAKYSDNSGALGGLAAGNFVQLAQGLQTDGSSSNASIAINKTGGTANILTLQKSSTNVLLLDNNGLLTLQPAASLSSGQTNITQTANMSVSVASGTAIAYGLTSTISSSGNSSNHVGFDVNLQDNSSTINTFDFGARINLFGSNVNARQIGVDSTVQKGIGLRGVSSGSSNQTISCGNLANSGLSIGVCGDSTDTSSGESIGTYGRSSSTGSLITSAPGSGVYGVNTSTTASSQFAAGVKGVTTGTGTAGTSTGVYGQANAGAGATFYGGYFTLGSGGATAGAALYASNSTVAANILDLQDNTTSVFTVGDGGLVTASTNSTTGFVVKDSSSTKEVFTIDTSGDQVILGKSGASGLDGKLTFKNATGSGTASIVLTSNPSTNYTYQLPTGTVSSNQCLQSGTVSGANVPLTFGSCGSGSGDNGFVNSVAVTDFNLQDVAASTSVTGTTWTASGSGPTNITLAISDASATTKGSVTTSAQTFAGVKTFQDFVILQPAVSMTAGQTALTQTLTNASSTGGTVNGYSQTITVSNTSSASTTNGINIAINDNASAIANTDYGININLSGTNSSQIQTGAEVAVARGYGIEVTSTGSTSASSICSGVTIGSAAICATGISASIISRTNGASSTIADAASSGVYSNSADAGSAGKFYQGVVGLSTQTASAAYTSTGVYGIAKGGSGATTYGGYFTLNSLSSATLGSALYASNNTVAANILNLQDNTTSVFTVGDGGLITMQPAASLTSGQTAVAQTLTNASSTGGTVNGYSQTITVSNTSSVSTTNGFNINLTDNATALANSNTGVKISLSGSNNSQLQIGLDSSVTRGIAIKGVSSATAGGSSTCGAQAGLSVGVCGDSTATGLGVGTYGRSSSPGGAINTAAGSGIYGENTSSGSAGSFYAGIKGSSTQSVGAAYTSVGVFGNAQAGSGATAYSGYFTLQGSSATLGSALYASNNTVAANILDLQDNTTSVFTVGDGGVTTAKSNSSTGFQIQDSSSSKQVLTIDTSGDQVLLGKAGASGLDGKLVFNNATNSNTLTIVTGVTAASGGSGYTLTLPTTGASSSGQCLQSDTGSTVSSTSLTFSSCGAGGGTFATTYSTTSQASNTIAYSNSGGGALIIQNASTPLSTVLSIDTASSTFHYLQLNLASSIPHLQVFGASSTAYADIYYDAGASTAHFTASTGTTQIGTGSGAVNITAGTGSAVAITGDANSTFTTTTGLVRLDGPSGVELGTASSRNGDLKFINLTNTNIIDLTVPSGASAPGASYTLTLPGSVGSPNQCLQNSGTAGILTFNACGSGSGDNITVNSTAATDANFLDVAATGTIAGTTWTLNTATNPDNITLAISTASASTAGIVSNTTQTFAGAKTFQSNAAGGFIVQDSANSKNILSVDTSGDQVVLGVAGTSGVNGKIVFNTTNASNASVTLVSQSTATSYSIVLPSATAGGTNYCLVGTNASGTTTTSWVPCGSGSTGKITLTPEYPGAVMTADGSGNTGTMTSDFCSGSSLRNIPSTSNPCGASEEHNFYTWVTTSQNDYDIWIRWQVPSDFSDFAASNAIQMYGWRTDNTATTSVTLSAYNSSGSQCGTSTNVATGTATWTQTSMGGTVTAAGCTISAGNVIDLRIQMAANNKTVRAGEITINYQRN